MRKIRDILRLRLAGGLSIRQINASTKVSLGSIQKLLSKANELELNWPLPDDLNDVQLALLFYPEADTGEIRETEIFVGVLGASNKTYAEATWSQKLSDWLGSHVRMFDYFGGCTAMVVPNMPGPSWRCWSSDYARPGHRSKSSSGRTRAFAAIICCRGVNATT